MFRQLRVRWPLLIAGALLGAVTLSSCGYNEAQNATASTPQLTSTDGTVTITINALSYRPSDTIIVTLNNQGSQTIFFVDQHTDCKVLLMQWQVDGKWQNIDNCYVARRSIWSTLGPRQQLQVKLDPPRGNWLPGRYHVNLDYSIGQASYSFTTLSSVDFQVENP
jgi:hypothetical protein